MRLVRSLLTGSLLALAVIGGSAGVVSAASSTHETFPIQEAWCFDDGLLTYCTEIDGTFKIVIAPDGDERSITQLTQHVVITDDAGQYVGEYTSRVNDQFRFSWEDGMTIKSLERIHSFDGELTCTSSIKVLIKDFEVKVDEMRGSCH
jgi:hypothetical protein